MEKKTSNEIKEMTRESRVLYRLARYAEAIKDGEGVESAACRAHFELGMYIKKGGASK